MKKLLVVLMMLLFLASCWISYVSLWALAGG